MIGSHSGPNDRIPTLRGTFIVAVPCCSDKPVLRLWIWHVCGCLSYMTEIISPKDPSRIHNRMVMLLPLTTSSKSPSEEKAQCIAIYYKIMSSPTTTRGFLGSLIRKSIVGLLPQSGFSRDIGKIQPYSVYTRRSDPSESAPKMPIDSEIIVALKDPTAHQKA